jgi:hypothetical protein
MEFQIKPGYLGMCMGPCDGQKDATTKVFQKWDPPMPATIVNGVELFPAVEGVFVHMCDECAAKAE